MQYQDFMIGGLVLNSLSNTISSLNTGNIWFDSFLSLLIIICINYMTDQKNMRELYNYVIKLTLPRDDKNIITFVSKKGACSQAFKALLFNLSKEPDDKNIKSLIEDENSKINRWLEYSDKDDGIKTLYRVNQSENFKFNENITGKIYTEEKESGELNGKIKYEEMVNLEIFSKDISMEKLQDFIEKCKLDYKNTLKEKAIVNQSIITIESSSKKSKSDENIDEIDIKKKEWRSFKTFSNTFFPGVDDIVDKIDFFANNREWYEEKGLPWTLGIMLSGVPGSGKTSFIKALMNHTNRHCVNVKLDDDFKMSELENIISDEEIDSDIIIPISNRIIVLEDIDAMGDIVKDRDLKEKEEKEEVINKEELIKAVKSDTTGVCELLKKENKFNLSKLLNIIDGLDEHPGRILIITTNKPEKLDKALVRPGRIDIALNFENCVSSDIHNILNHFWSVKESNSKIDLSKYDKLFSPAMIINFCRMTNSYQETLELMENNLRENSLLS